MCLTGLRLLFFMIAFGLPLLGLDPKTEPGRYVHQSWGMREGLPQLTVYRIVQSRDGYLWLATQQGLSRFDGTLFKNFDRHNTPEMTGNEVMSLYESSNGTLWAGMVDGSLLSYRDGQFSRLSHPALESYWINDIKEDRVGNLWLGSIKGLAMLAPGSTEIVMVLPNLWINQLLITRDGSLWIATNGSGVIRKNQELVTTWTNSNGLSDKDITCLAEDDQGGLWLGTRNHGLMRLKNENIEVFDARKDLPHPGIRSLLFDRDGNLWIGTSARGLVRYDGQKFSTYSSKHVLSQSLVVSMLEDNEGHLWAGTFSKGLFRLGDSRFKTLPLNMGDGVAWMIYEDPNGALWFNIEDIGILRYQDGKKENLTQAWKMKKSVLVTGIHIEANGDGWISTQDEGLFHKTGDKIEVFTFQEQINSTSPAVISSLLLDRSGRLWVAYEGLSCFKDGVWTHFHSSYLGAHEISALYQDRLDRIWVGTALGPARIPNPEEPRLHLLDCRVNQIIRAIYEDSMGRMWLTTSGAGLIRIKDDNCQVFTQADGLFSDNTFFVMEDRHRNLWITGNQGIYRIALDTFDQYLDGRLARLDYQSFGLADGLPSAECNFSGTSSGLKQSNGTLWFPTLAGLTFVNPDELRLHDKAPAVLIDSLSVNDQLFVAQNVAILPPGSANLEFSYTAFSWHDPAQIRFAYQLEGFDRDWIQAQGRRFARYTKLQPGHYRFLVKAANSDGVWNHDGAVLSFDLAPHFMQTNLFKSLCVLTLMILAISTHLIRLSRHRRNEEYLSRRILESTNELTATNEELVKANRQLAENARQAGMAEIATEVLHNIGNVMNSANTSANMMVKIVNEDLNNRAVHYLDQLVRENQHHLGQWLDTDPKGLKVLPSLHQLCPILSESREAFFEESRIFASQLEHIREIVSAQSRLGDPLHVEDYFEIEAAVKSVIKMQGPIIRGIKLSVVNLMDRDIFLKASKSDFFQVMTNLLKNACEALHSSETDEAWEIQVRLYTAANMACIDVIDNGCGMDQATMDHLFQHGFTTKNTGHGFGLHYCRKAVQQMGGNLEAFSLGFGQGATMTLRAPIFDRKEDPL